MNIINEVFATIKADIIFQIQLPHNFTPYMVARPIAVSYGFDPSLTRLLLKGIEEIWSTYKTN